MESFHYGNQLDLSYDEEYHILKIDTHTSGVFDIYAFMKLTQSLKSTVQHITLFVKNYCHSVAVEPIKATHYIEVQKNKKNLGSMDVEVLSIPELFDLFEVP